MIRRLAAPLAILVAIAVFAVFFLLLSGAGPALRLGAPVLLAAVGATGIYLMLARSEHQRQQDDYSSDARARVREVEATLQQLAGAARRIRDPQVRAAVARAGEVVPELLDRIAETQPSSLYSSAARFGGHVTSLLGLVEKYADIEQHPTYYTDAPRLLADGRAAVERFDQFALDSIRLVNQGEMAEYQANLDTVAPPELPTLGG
ncbi:5-bromo-4-chloroindolyl phosphate hydrolysis family protein [Raineyella sp. LH-20]|uniref:5-bromo-4-chloroindolyl phosphate hydrolysis family protein n=1 Tax=Raineyella sp. LH-20 TaxID=3081204 RepID=UPI002955C35D|nr:5-bromo-4-chloroindolyl phosphate hydrolysis family protein [Raineyella sp. LH-20]WOP18742.1 5-bromo-4-chloroindolyl phosphate hydrolysis family protein [Raineyella sp. LH-20]